MKRTGGSDRRGPETFSDRVLSWRELVERCGRKPTRKRVHALRVVTLKLQVEVEIELNELPSASHEARAMMRFSRLAEKLRHALGIVRELDVWMSKLSGLRESLSGTMTYVPRSNRESGRQLERLERRLMRKRERAEAKLVREIAKRQDALLLAATHLQRSTGACVVLNDEEQALKLLKEYAGIVADFPDLGEENLHDFRKRIKRIRYLAERNGSDPLCGRIAAQMQDAQSAIGEWHDWQVLARTARHGKHAKDVEAIELLTSLTAEAFEEAIATCDLVLRSMGEQERELETGLNVARKGPVRDERAVASRVVKLA